MNNENGHKSKAIKRPSALLQSQKLNPKVDLRKQSDDRWHALLEYYGIEKGSHVWRERLIHALAIDLYPGFQLMVNPPGPAPTIKSVLDLESVIQLILDSKAQVLFTSDVIDGFAIKIPSHLSADALRAVARDITAHFERAGARASIVAICEQLRKHRDSPWKGVPTQTIRSTYNARVKARQKNEPLFFTDIIENFEGGLETSRTIQSALYEASRHSDEDPLVAYLHQK